MLKKKINRHIEMKNIRRKIEVSPFQSIGSPSIGVILIHYETEILALILE